MRRWLRTEQVTEGEVVTEEGFGLADVVVDFGKGAPDFLVRVTGIGEGVLLHLDFAEFQAIVQHECIRRSNVVQFNR